MSIFDDLHNIADESSKPDTNPQQVTDVLSPTATPQAKSSSIFEDLHSIADQQQEVDKQDYLNNRGWLGNIGSAAARGVVGAGETMLRAARALDPEGGTDVVNDLTTRGIEGIKKFEENTPFLQQVPSEQSGFLPKSISGGVESATQSIVSGLPGMAAGAAIGSAVPVVGTALGALAGYALSGGTTFGLSQFDQTLEEAKKAGVPHDQAVKEAVIQGLAEGGFEFASDLIGGHILGLDNPVTKPAKEALKQGIKSMLSQTIGQFAKKAAMTTAVETGSEMLTGGVQAESQKRLGLGDQNFWQGASDAFGPSVVASLIFAGLGGAGAHFERQHIKTSLENPNVDAKSRTGAVEQVYGTLKQVDPTVAEAWKTNAEDAIKNNRSIATDEDLYAKIQNLSSIPEASRSEQQKSNLAAFQKEYEDRLNEVGIKNQYGVPTNTGDLESEKQFLEQQLRSAGENAPEVQRRLDEINSALETEDLYQQKRQNVGMPPSQESTIPDEELARKAQNLASIPKKSKVQQANYEGYQKELERRLAERQKKEEQLRKQFEEEGIPDIRSEMLMQTPLTPTGYRGPSLGTLTRKPIPMQEVEQKISNQEKPIKSQVVYSGLSQPLDIEKMDGLGAHFTNDESLANQMAGDFGDNGIVNKVRINIKNPLRMNDVRGSHTAIQVAEELVNMGILPKDYVNEDFHKRLNEGVKLGDNEAWEASNLKELGRIKGILQEKGYDGIVYDNLSEGGGDSYIPFSKDQIEIIGHSPLRTQEATSAEEIPGNQKQSPETGQVPGEVERGSVENFRQPSGPEGEQGTVTGSEVSAKGPEEVVPTDYSTMSRKEFESRREAERQKEKQLTDTFFNNAARTISENSGIPEEKIRKEYASYFDAGDALGFIQDAVNTAHTNFLSDNAKSQLHSIYDEYNKASSSLDQSFLLEDEDLRKSGFFSEYKHLKPGSKINPVQETPTTQQPQTAQAEQGRSGMPRLNQDQIDDLYNRGIVQNLAKDRRKGFEQILGEKLTDDQTGKLMVEMLQQARERGDFAVISDSQPNPDIDLYIRQAWDAVQEKPRTEQLTTPSTTQAEQGEVIDTEKLQNLKQMLEDHIATYKANGRQPNQQHLDKLAEVKAQLNGTTKPEGISSNAVFGHPEATNFTGYENLIPITVKDAESVDRRLDITQAKLDELQSRIGKAEAISKGQMKATKQETAKANSYLKSANYTQDVTIRDLLREETIPELNRLKKNLSESGTVQASQGKQEQPASSRVGEGEKVASGKEVASSGIESTIEITKEETGTVIKADIPAKKANALKPLEQKKFLLAEIDKAIKALGKETHGKGETIELMHTEDGKPIEVENTITFDVPGDGTFKVANNQLALNRFKSTIQSRFPTASKQGAGPAFKTYSISPSKTRVSGEGVSYYNEYKVREANDNEIAKNVSAVTADGFITNNNFAMLPPKGFKTPSEKLSVEAKTLLSKNPIPVSEMFELNSGTDGKEVPTVHAIAEDKDGVFNAKYVDYILSKYPNAKAYLDSSNLLSFEDNGDVVGIVMPITYEKESGFAKFLGEQRNPKQAESQEVVAEQASNTEQPTSKTEQVPSTKEGEKPGGLQDFGEKLGGAKKDKSPSITDISDEDLASLPMSKIWPKSSVDSIEDINHAAIAQAVRDSIPNKPQKGYKLRQWVESVKLVRTIMDHTERLGADAILQKMGEYKTLSKLADKINFLRELPREHWSRIGKVDNHPNAYSYDDNGNRIPKPYVSADIDGRIVHADNFEDLKAKTLEMLSGEKKTPEMQFEVRGKEGAWGINKKGDPLYRKLITFDTPEKAFEYIKNNRDALSQAWEDLKERENVKQTDVRKEENRPRTGKDYRQGKDATPEMFMDAFGFRGVEFGNWVSQGANQKERQGMLNESYDALMDLANIVGVPPKALSLNGELGLGLGSRGSGWASAHFEPDKIVINLTKTRGAGSLAHEWIHSLDNYFQRKRNLPGSVMRQNDMVTQMPGSSYINKETGHALTAERFEKLKERNAIRDIKNWELVTGVRPEVEQAFNELVKALNDSPMAKRSSLIDKGKSSGYWSRVYERAARAFENYVIAKMQREGYHNDYLANVVTVKEFQRDVTRYPYLLDEELKPVEEAFDNLFQTLQTKQTDKGVALYSLRTSEAQKTISTISERIKSSVKGGIHVVDTFTDLPYHLQSDAVQMAKGDVDGIQGQVRGVYDAKTDSVYLVSSNLKDSNEAQFVLLHEVLGHRAINSVLGEKATSFFNELFAVKSAQMADHIRTYEADVKTREGRTLAASEWFADEVAAGRYNEAGLKGWWNRFVTMFREGMRKLGFTLKLSDAEIADVVRRARSQVEKGTKATTGQAQFSIKQRVQDELKAVGKTLQSIVKPKDASFWSGIFSTPEWANHPAEKKAFEATQEREDRRNELVIKHKEPIDALKAIKKSDPEGYKKAGEILVDMDVKMRPWEKVKPTLEGQVKPEVIAAVDAVRKHYDQLLEYMRKPIKEVLDTLDDNDTVEVPLNNGKTKTYTKNELLELYQYMGSLKGFYAPRIRESGDYYIRAKGPDGQLYRYHKPSIRQMEKLRLKLQREGYTDIETGNIARLPEDVYQDLDIVDMGRAIENAINKANIGDETVRREMKAEALVAASNILKARGFRSHKISRTADVVVKGYLEDPIESYLKYLNQTAGGIAKGEAAKKMYEALQGVKAENEPKRYERLRGYIQEQLRNPDKWDRAIALGKSIVSFKYLTSPRSALVNTTAMVTTAPPAILRYALNNKGSLTKIMSAIAKAGVDYSKAMIGKGKLSEDEQAFIDDIHKRGYDNPQLTRDAMRNVEGAFGKTWQQTMQGAMYLFGKTEQWNRGTTMLAAYRLAKKAGQTHEQAMESARLASDRAHGIYGKGSLPYFAQGSNPFAKIAQMGYSYSKFGHNYLQMLYDHGVSKESIKGLAFALAAPAVVGGASAFAGYSILMGVVKGLMHAFGDDRDPERMVYDTIRSVLGETGEKAVRYGAVGTFAGDITSSLAVGMEIPKNLIDLTGPFGGAVQDIGKAAKFLGTGQPIRAAEQIAPTAISNLIKAHREAMSGAVTSDGSRVWDKNGKPYFPTTGETLRRAMGLKSTERSLTEAHTWEAKREASDYANKRKHIYEEYRAYLASPKRSQDDLADIMDSIKRYNDSVKRAGRQKEVALITRDSMHRQVLDMQKPNKRTMSTIKSYAE